MSKVKMENNNMNAKEYSKRVILNEYKGIKKDVLISILDDRDYRIDEVDELYKKFLEGGKK